MKSQFTNFILSSKSQLTKLKISHLEDLKDKIKLGNIFLDLLRKFKDLTIVDDFSSKRYKSEKCYLYKCTNPNYWELFFKDKDPSYKHKLFREFNKKISELNLDKTKRFLTYELKEKYVFLING